jgi:hypothetical protein
MERLRKVAGGARLFAAAALAAAVAPAVGCVSAKSFESMEQSVKEAVAPAKPKAAAEFACAWQNRLSMLPDPTRGGTMSPGLVGQVFLYSAPPDYKPAEVTGDLTVSVQDQTPRPPGMSAPKAEVWHFTKDVLKKMVVADERFGRSVAVFLPWPEAWRDVTRVYIQARYDQPDTHTLYSQPATVTLDMSSPGGVTPGMQAMPPVPDPAVVMRQMRAANVSAQQGQPAPVGMMQAAYAPPAITPPGLPTGNYGWMPNQTGGFAPPTGQIVPSTYQPQPNAVQSQGFSPNELVVPQRR